MEKESLHTFFAGKATWEEKEALMQWMEKDSENKRLFLNERKMYNAILLHGKELPVQAAEQTQSSAEATYLDTRIRFLNRWIRVAAIFLLAFGLGYYVDIRERVATSPAMQTISVPAGQYVHIHLPDGSNIWLNAQTTIRYPVSFNQRERLVTLDGEAYFEVAKDASRPFIVRTKECQIEVKGTKFNVDAYSSRNKFETALMEGCVQVSMLDDPDRSVSLRPCQKVVYTGGRLWTEKVNDFERYRWKEGLLCFQDVPFGTLMDEFERFYGVTIVVNNRKVTQYLYTGKFKQTDGIEYALSLLQKSFHFSYRRDMENHVIYINE